MAKKTQNVNLDFAFFLHLLNFYQQNKGRIRQNYKALSKRFLDFNDPTNSNAFLRLPQFEALEIYVFLRACHQLGGLTLVANNAQSMK